MRWTKKRRGIENDGFIEEIFDIKIFSQGHLSEVTFEQRPKDDEGMCHVDIWGSDSADIAKSVQRPQNRRMAGIKKHEKAHVAKKEKMSKRVILGTEVKRSWRSWTL